MSTTPSAPQPEGSKAATKPTGLVPSRIEAVGKDRIRIEFQIEDLVSQLLTNMRGAFLASCGGCKGCSAREMVLSCAGCKGCSAAQ